MIWVVIIPVGIVLASIVAGFLRVFHAAAIINDPGAHPPKYATYTPVDPAKQVVSDASHPGVDHDLRMTQDLHALAAHILAIQPDPQLPKYSDKDQTVRPFQSTTHS